MILRALSAALLTMAAPVAPAGPGDPIGWRPGHKNHNEPSKAVPCRSTLWVAREVVIRGPRGQVFVRGVVIRGPRGQVFVREVDVSIPRLGRVLHPLLNRQARAQKRIVKTANNASKTRYFDLLFSLFFQIKPDIPPSNLGPRADIFAQPAPRAHFVALDGYKTPSFVRL